MHLRTGVLRTQAQLDCNFDSDTCGWQQIQLDDEFDWERESGDTPTSDTGPWGDHTSGCKPIFTILLGMEG